MDVIVIYHTMDDHVVYIDVVKSIIVLETLRYVVLPLLILKSLCPEHLVVAEHDELARNYLKKF